MYILENNYTEKNNKKWPEIRDERLPGFPTKYLPADCAELVEKVASTSAIPVDYAACGLLGTASAA